MLGLTPLLLLEKHLPISAFLEALPLQRCWEPLNCLYCTSFFFPKSCTVNVLEPAGSIQAESYLELPFLSIPQVLLVNLTHQVQPLSSTVDSVPGTVTVSSVPTFCGPPTWHCSTCSSAQQRFWQFAGEVPGPHDN